MIIIHIFVLFTLAGMLYFYLNSDNLPAPISIEKLIVPVLIAAFLFRCVLACLNQGFSSDTACFAGWANTAFENGFSHFYSADTFSDYPPGYIYILYVTGALFHLFKIEYLSAPCLLLLKLPSILCDIAAGYLLYRAAKKYLPENQVLWVPIIYLFNPAIILNSSLWGQVDAVFTLTVILMCLFLTDGKMVPAYIVFGIGVLIKPQMLVFAPVLIYGIIDHVILEDFDWHNFFYNLFSGLFVILCMGLVCMPFGLDLVLEQYTSTLGSYPYVAVNAFNFWGMFGLNWVSQESKLLFLSYSQWGVIIILFIVFFSALLFFKTRDKRSRYFTSAAFLIISMFLFSVRMHERYLFPALALLLFAYSLRSIQEYYLCYTGFSALHLYNTAYMLYFYDPVNYDRKASGFVIASFLMTAMGIFFYRSYYLYDVKNLISNKKRAFKYQLKAAWDPWDKTKRGAPMASEQMPPFTRVDVAIMLTVTIVYSISAFWDLGDLRAPKSAETLGRGDSIVLQLDEGTAVESLYCYLGNCHNVSFALDVREDDTADWHEAAGFETVTFSSVFCWNRVSLPAGYQYYRLTCSSAQAVLTEFVLKDTGGQIFMPVNAPDHSTLFDEADLFPEQVSFRNGTYFDEIYHARTAYEFLHGLPTYENTHPPLGKIFIAAGVAIFGMTPFGWRFAGTFFGILMVPVMYLIGRILTKDRALAGFACVLLTFDFMHFAQTRIATIDVFVTFFIMLMYLFMFRYMQMSFYDTPLKKTFLPLGACGISMGLGIACKWTGAYAGVGLALLFFATLLKRYKEYQYAVKDPDGSTNGIFHWQIKADFKPHTIKTLLFCGVFFVLIPALIYLLSYIPFRSGHDGLFARMWANQQSMLSYHTRLVSTHPYSSPWYQWPAMIRPIFYYSGHIGENLRQGISSFGNPLVWWAGVPAFMYMLSLILTKKDRIASILCVSYLAQFLPWCLVSRLTFIYHYFPSVPFVVLMIVYAASKLKERMHSSRNFHIVIGVYSFAVLVLFCLFYPVLSGKTVSIAYVDNVLRWMDTWVLISG